jgi:hypothetical protein
MRRNVLTRFMFVLVGSLAFVAASQRATAMIDCEDPEHAEEEYCVGSEPPGTNCCYMNGVKKCCGRQSCTIEAGVCTSLPAEE